jgi:hypothetical protein
MATRREELQAWVGVSMRARVTGAADRVDGAVDRHLSATVQRALSAGLLAVCGLMVCVALVASMFQGTPARDARVGVMAINTLSKTPGPAATTPVPAARAKVAGLPARRRRPTTTTSTTQPPGPAIPATKGALPIGKGMWLYNFDRSDSGDPAQIVKRSEFVGLTHLYVRTGSSVDGFYAQRYLDRLLPAAHAHGIRVYGWDFPYLDNYQADVARAVAAITYRTPDGQSLDGFTADIETRSEGVNITPATGRAYGILLRQRVGHDYPLIATVPRPNVHLKGYPFAEVTENFNAIAPMVYWLNREPGSDVLEGMNILKTLGKPIMPVGQAYNGAPEGGRPGVPPPAELRRFMQVSAEQGAAAVSFWSWQAADQPAWDAIREATWFMLPVVGDYFSVAQVRSYQTLLDSLGFPTAVTGIWDANTISSTSIYQQKARLPVTGGVDPITKTFLLRPFAPPIRPLI